jgi:hypothetical protein
MDSLLPVAAEVSLSKTRASTGAWQEETWGEVVVVEETHTWYSAKLQGYQSSTVEETVVPWEERRVAEEHWEMMPFLGAKREKPYVHHTVQHTAVPGNYW